jgi:hypothetical protein
MGPNPASTVLSPEEEAAAGAFRQPTQRPLDDGLDALQAPMPRRTRPALPRLFQRHGIRRWPLTEKGQSPANKKCKAAPMGYLHVAFAEAQTEQGRVCLCVAVDRTSQGAFAEWPARAMRRLAAEFLRRVLPYGAHR